MSGISLGPIASGLPKDIVERLLEVERKPLKRLEDRKSREQTRLELVQDLKGRINGMIAEFQAIGRFRDFQELKAEVGREDLMDIFVDKEKAEPGEYAVEVMQLAGRSSMLSNGFSDANDTQIGVGYFSYELPSGETREIFIDEDENTLHEIASKINNAPGLNLQALVVDDGTGTDEPWRLIISHNGTGEVNDAEFPTFYFIDGDEDFYLDGERAAKNSIVKVNGFPVEFEGNRFDTLVPGLTIDLKDADPGKEFNVKIMEDLQQVQGKVVAVVEKLNEVLAFIQQQNQIDENTDTSRTLGGDITLQNLEGLIRRYVLEPVDTRSGPMRFSDLGVTFQRNGLLDLDQNKLEATITNRFKSVGEFFAGIRDSGGFVGKVRRSAQSFVRPGGLVSSREDGIQSRIRDMDRQIENTERQLEQKERTLKTKFSNLESTMARLKAQQAQVSGALGSRSLIDNISLA